jgi:hypothetical protein
MNTTTEVLELCKRGELSHAQIYSEMTRFAEMQRQRGESRDQAFAYFVTKTQEGKELFAAYRKLPGSDFDTTKAEPVSVSKPAVVAKDDGPGWSETVAAYAKAYNLSEGAAINQMLACPDGQRMFRSEMRKQRMRNPDFSENDHLYEDACDAAREESRIAKANTKASEFMDLVSQMRSKFPAMTLSDAMERAQSLYPEAWRKYREMDVKADPADPNAAPLSGKPTPSRAPLWQGPNTSSELTPPRKFPVANDTVRFKSAAAQTAEANFAFFTKILYDASAKAGRPWSVEKCIATLRQCPAAAQYFNAAVAA